MRLSLLAAVGALALATASPANAVIIDLDHTQPLNLELSGTPGTWRITPVGTAQGGAFDAFSPWGETTGCDEAGANCARGWKWGYTLRDEGGDILSTFETNALADGWFETPAAALASARAQGPFEFTLDEAATIAFTYDDSNFADNRGGISLDFQLLNGGGPGVPEPAGMLLLGAGLLLLGAGRRSLRKI
ncbi:MAG: hypothetical protein HQL39_10425 [Alphaproteobacteria bacterium]|nr:hypothetical protein [Alphaproteobacteria bacterium]